MFSANIDLYIFRLTRIRTMALFYLFIVIFLATLTGLGTHLQPYFDADTPIYIAVSKYHSIMIICSVLCMNYII